MGINIWHYLLEVTAISLFACVVLNVLVDWEKQTPIAT